MTEQKPLFDPIESLKNARLNPLEDIERPPVLIEMNGKPILHLGSFSVIGGKAKARKGFLVGVFATAAAVGRCSIKGIIGYFHDKKTNVLCFDTEQGKFWGSKAHKRICENMGVEDPVNLHYFDLQGFSPQERLAMIDQEIMSNDTVSLVIIDGIRDLIMSINDESEATMMVTTLLKWCAAKQIHIIVILHQNKGDYNLRGHIGTELVNKAELVMSVTKEKDESTSTVKAEHEKGQNFSSFSLVVDDDGLPRLAEIDRPAVTKKTDEEKTRFEYVFKEHLRMSNSLLVERYMDASGLKESAANKHIAAALVAGLIDKDTEGFYTFLLTHQTESDDENIPF